jgi:anaerobic selenocysteine-containing dehydrogenase/ferredoxin-NADP reductase
MIEEKVGFCSLCRSRCGTINLVENGRMIAVKPNPDHPTGKAICPKGRAAPEIAHSARRLTRPLRRTMPKGAANPGWREISWEEALAEISERLNRYRVESGPESVAFSVTSGSSSATSDSLDWIQRFVRSFGSPNNCVSTEICNWHKDVAHAFTFGCGMPTPDYANSELIILWGHNPANVWLAGADSIATGRKHGARLVVVDPRRSESARGADSWLRVRPGTDAALALGLARWLIEHEAFDQRFVTNWTNGPYLVRDDNGLLLRTGDIGLDGRSDDYVVWDEVIDGPRPSRATDATPRVRLRGKFNVAGQKGDIGCKTAFERLAEACSPYDLAAVEAITSIAAPAIEAFAQAIAAAKSISYHAWTGIGQSSNATQTERAIATLYALTGSFDKPGGNRRLPQLPVPPLHSMNLIPEATRRKALGFASRPLGPPAEGWITPADLYDAIIDERPYRVRALFGFGSNLLVSHPNPVRGKRALEALEFQVHCDLFMNPTAEMADIVLPVSSPWEHEALRIGFELNERAQGQVQLRQQIVPPVGESRSDMWIVFQLAKRLNLGEAFFHGDMEAGWNHQLKPLGLDVGTLRGHPQGIVLPLEYRAQKYRETGFATQTGKAELYSEPLLRHGYEALPVYKPPDDRRSATFPLRLFSANSGYFCHSQHRGITTLRKRRPEPSVALHPDLARALEIEMGDWVKISTGGGSFRSKARFDDELDPGTVLADYGWWESNPDLGLPGLFGTDPSALSANFNNAIADENRDPISGSLPLRSVACAIERFGQRSWQGYRPLIVTDIRLEGRDIVEVVLRSPEGEPLAPFHPGQFITLRLDGVSRSYSLIGAANELMQYRIAVKHVPGGVMSGMIVNGLRIGQTVDVQAPEGSFRLPLENEFPVVLIAGGIGITPFLSYLESLTGAEAEPSEIILHYACRDGRAFAFSQRIEMFKRKLPGLKVVTNFSQPRPGDICDVTGRFDPEKISNRLVAGRARFYVCATESMMNTTISALARRGVRPFEIFREKFSAAQVLPRGEWSARNLTFRKSNKTVVWSPGRGTILECAEAAGVVLPAGCRVGQCENCAVAVRSGEVAHLADVDVEDGTCLTCQAWPASDLVLDA